MNYTCPFCSQHTTITAPNNDYTIYNFDTVKCMDPTLISNFLKVNGKESLDGKTDEEIIEMCSSKVGSKSQIIVCPNSMCQRISLKFQLHKTYIDLSYNRTLGSKLYSWNLLPESVSLILPKYIPIAIQEDYYEACRIRDLSPKASATLARRCLQGMIRDFWKVVDRTLNKEIDALKEKIQPDVWEGIDSIRKVGNIGAHMEKDIDLIIDVSPDEAQLLISLIEQLIEEWYVNKHNRETRLHAVKEMAEAKTKEKGRGLSE